MSRFIELTRGKVAIVDDDDYVIVSRMNWYAKPDSKTWYAVGRNDRKAITMHRFIINPPEGYEVDHRNGNGLDNRKINLRACLKKHNQRNKTICKNNQSGFKGVFKASSGFKFRAKLVCERIKFDLGRYESAIDAARAYDKAAIEHFGEYAKTNESMGLLPCLASTN